MPINAYKSEPTYRPGFAWFEPYIELPSQSDVPSYGSCDHDRNLSIINEVRATNWTPIKASTQEDSPQLSKRLCLSFSDEAHHRMEETGYRSNSDDLPNLTELNSADIDAMDQETLNKILAEAEDMTSLDRAPPPPMEDDTKDVDLIGDDADNDALTKKPPHSSQALAEVILIHTSLGMARNIFFDSIRLRHYLDAKQINYYVVDVNKEWALGHGLVDQNLIETWWNGGLLYPDPYDESKLLVPQVLIDGVSVGSYQDVQDMEEDDDLDWSLSREQCPSCFHPRTLRDEFCESCQVVYQQLISPAIEMDGRVLLVKGGEIMNNEEVLAQKIETDRTTKDLTRVVDVDFE